MNKWKMLGALTLAVGLVLAGTASGATLYVDDDSTTAGVWYKTITEALAAPPSVGDTILVYPGTYDTTGAVTWPLNLNVKGLVLMSSDGADTTIIYPGAAGRGAIEISQDSVIVNGFTIKGGTEAHDATHPMEHVVWVHADYSTIKNNAILVDRGNTAGIMIADTADSQPAGPGGTALYGYNVAKAKGHTIQNNSFRCKTSGEGWSIFAYDLTDSCLIKGNQFHGDAADVGNMGANEGATGTGIIIHKASKGGKSVAVTIENNTAQYIKYSWLTFNAAYPYVDVAGYMYEQPEDGTVADVVVKNNTVHDCGKDAVHTSGTGVTFQGEKKTDAYGADSTADLTIGTGRVTIQSNTFYENEYGIWIKAPKGPLHGKYGCVLQADSIVISNNDIYDNTSYGVYNGTIGAGQDDTPNAIDADSNWWGTTAGPKHSITNPHTAGNAVNDSIIYIPWLAASGGAATGGIPKTVLISASPTSIVVGGDSSTITATLIDALGNPISDTMMKVQSADSAYIDFSVITGTAFGSVSPTADTTDDWGHVTTKFKSLTKAGNSTVKGVLRGSSPAITATVGIGVIAGPLAQVKTTPADTTVVVTEDAIIVAELQDQYANPIAATSVDEVTFSLCDTATAMGGTLGTKTLTAGKIQVPYTTYSLVETGLDTITATTATGSYTDYSVVSTIGGAPKTMKLWAAGDSTVVVSRGDSTLALHDTLFDVHGNKSVYSSYYPKKYYKVTFSVSPGGPTFSDTTKDVNTIGYCTINYESDTLIGEYTVTATCGDANKSLVITQTHDAIAAASFTTADTVPAAAGEKVTLTAELQDQFANPIKADSLGAIVFSKAAIADSGLGELGGKTIPSDSLTVSVKYTAYAEAIDTATIVATPAGGGTADTSIVINTAPAALAKFALTRSPAKPTAGDEVTVTITAKDAGNFRIYTYDNDDIITLTLDGTAAEASQVRWIIPTTPPDTVLALTASIPESTFTTGQCVVKITNEKADTVTVTAVDTAGHTGTCDTIIWAPVALLDHYGVVAQTDPIYVDEAFTITVTPCDSFGNATTADLPRLIKFLANETGVSVPSDQLLAEPTDYTVTATNATTSLKITVSDYATPAITGTSDSITVGVRPTPTYTVSGVVGLTDNLADSSGSVVSIDSDVDTTDAHGAYSIAGLLTGTYDIYVTHDGYFSDSAIGVAISADTTIDFTLSPIWSDEIAMKTGWNMVSVPVTVEETGVSSVFPGNSAVWTYGTAGYTAPTDVEVGAGYWVKYTYDTTITITGVPATTYTKSLAAGWNMIGSISEAVALSAVVVDPTDVDLGALWGYDPVGGYTLYETISPLKGYWIFADSACEITVEASGGKAGGAAASVKKEDKTSDLIWAVDVKVESEGIEKTLTIGSAASATSGYDSHFDRLLPPPAPGGEAIDASFRLEDARFARCVTDIREFGANEWKLTVKNAPEFKVSWGALDIPEDMTLTLCAGSKTVDMRSKSSISVKGISSVKIVASMGAPVPKVFALSQNAPNPFANRTSISLQIPARVHTTVVIYNIAGRLVKTLMDKDTDAGYYTLSWDGTDNSGRKIGSGIYFCKVQAGESTATRKLTLLR